MACRMSYFKIFVLFSTSLKILRLYLVISYTSMFSTWGTQAAGGMQNFSFVYKHRCSQGKWGGDKADPLSKMFTKLGNNNAIEP
jgi:hypothetical protein